MIVGEEQYVNAYDKIKYTKLQFNKKLFCKIN